MNTRSLTFQLVGWYAVALLLLCLLLGIGSYFALKQHLVRSLRERQETRARLICERIKHWTRTGHDVNWKAEVERAFAPSSYNRLVRVSSGESVLYSYLPRSLEGEPGYEEGEISVPGSSNVRGVRVVAAMQTVNAHGREYLVVSGATTTRIEGALQNLIRFIAVTTPVVIAAAAVGGRVLVKRALLPVVRITEQAERISVRDLSYRLPNPNTDDELERLSSSLNNLLSRLEESIQHARRFMADASHELRTPLTILKGRMEGLLTEEPSGGELEKVVGELLEETNRLSKIVEALFALSRLDSGDAQREVVPVDLGKLAGSTTEQIALLAEDKGIHLKCASEQDVFVSGDPLKLKQIVVNLLDNAIKYTPREGSVVLTVWSQNNKAILEVKDTGVGIPDELLPRIFDRFFRVDKARSRNLGGAGLGLAIVKAISAAHSGHVTVQSEFGKGSVFRVELPRGEIP